MVKRLIHSVIFLMCMSFSSYTQSVLFNNTYGNSGLDHARGITTTQDGGYAITGSSSSWGHGNSDAYLFKIDGGGELQWAKTFGGAQVDWGQKIVEDLSGNLIFCGYSNSFSGNYDMYMVKTSATGEVLWETHWGDDSWSFAYDLCIDSLSGALYCVGETYNGTHGAKDVHVTKVNAQGTVVWETDFGTADQETGNCILLTSDAELVIGGSKAFTNNGIDSTSAYALKLDTNGQLIWEVTYAHAQYLSLSDVTEKENKKIVFSGTTNQVADRGWDYWLLETDEDTGELLWESNLGGTQDDEGTGVITHPTGDLILAGTTNSYGNVNGNGEIRNIKCYRTTAGGGYQSGQNPQLGNNDTEECYDIVLTKDSGYVLVGSNLSDGTGYTSAYAVKIGKDNAFNSSVTHHEDVFSVTTLSALHILVFPNPLQNTLNVHAGQQHLTRIVLRDISGRIVLNTALSKNNTQIPIHHLSPGMYFLSGYNNQQLLGQELLIKR